MTLETFALIFGLALSATIGQAQSPMNPRARALTEQAAIYGQDRPFRRNYQEQIENFRDLPELVISEEAQSLPADTFAQGAASLVELWYAGRRIRLGYSQPQVVGGKSYSLLRGAGVTFLMIDGLARAVLTFNEKDATISPILTSAMILSGSVLPPNEQADSQPLRERRTNGFPYVYDLIVSGSEIGLGLWLGTGARGSNPSPRWNRRLRIVGAFVLVDGAASFQNALQHNDPMGIPIFDFVTRVVANQPVYGDLSIGDLSEEGLRRLGWLN